MSDFSELLYLKILRIIHLKLSINELLELGLDYSQIALLLNKSIEKNFLADEGEAGLILTTKGVETLESLQKKIYPKYGQEWINPLDKERINKIGQFDIYLPERKKR